MARRPHYKLLLVVDGQAKADLQLLWCLQGIMVRSTAEYQLDQKYRKNLLMKGAQERMPDQSCLRPPAAMTLKTDPISSQTVLHLLRHRLHLERNSSCSQGHRR